MINKTTLVGSIILSVIISACGSSIIKNDQYAESMNTSIAFFDQAFDAEKGVYFSEVDYDGKVTSSNIHTVALSRMIYGLSYASQWNPECLRTAKACIDYQLKYMTGVDSTGLYFIPEEGGDQLAKLDRMDIWQQAYGLCGLSEYYRQTKDSSLLQFIHQGHRVLIHRFQDKQNGGFYADYSALEGGVKGSKTIQSLMYPLTAYMLNLWEADKENSQLYEPVIKEHLSIAYNKVWNDSLQWVNVQFDDEWNAIYESDKAFVTAGHNFQFAALLLRSADLNFIDADHRKNYRHLALKILDSTLAKDIWSGQGFYAGFNPLTNAVKDRNLSWWQHSEAIIALSLAGESYADELIQLKFFYFNNFVDKVNGGEIANINSELKPLIEPKGQKGKSVYHHIEMIRFLINNNEEITQ